MDNQVRAKMECFRLQIKNNDREKIFHLNRYPQSPQHYQMIMQQYNQIPLIDLLQKINFRFKQPIEEMLQNDLAAQLVKQLVSKTLYEEWELFKEILQYLLLVSKLPGSVLVPYLIQHDMFQNLTNFYSYLILELLINGKCVVGVLSDASLNYLAKGETIQTKLSYTFILFDSILFNIVQQGEARSYMQKSKQFVNVVSYFFHIQMDDEVLELHLRLTSLLLQHLQKQDKDFISHAVVFIRPICMALQWRNIQNLNYILEMLLNLTLVGMENGYINTFFMYGGCFELMKILEEGLNDKLCLRITAEIASQSLSHIEILFENRLLEILKNKLASNSNQVQHFALLVVEYCLGGANQFHEIAYHHFDITNQVMNLLSSKNTGVSQQACVTMCCYFKMANNQEIHWLCLSGIHLRIIQFFRMEDEHLQSEIMGVIQIVLSLEAWQGIHCYYISQSERNDIRLILETIESNQVDSVLAYL